MGYIESDHVISEEELVKVSAALAFGKQVGWGTWLNIV